MGYLPTGAVWTTGCGRGRSAATAAPTKAKDATPAITNLSIKSPLKLPSTPCRLYLAGRSTHATNRRPNWQSRDLFFGECCRMGTPVISAYGWENLADRLRVGAIAVAERFQHHSFFPGDAAKIQGAKPDQSRETGNPVGQQKCLSDSKTPNTSGAERIIAWHRSSATSKRLDAIPGIGPALATALVASIADPKAFRSGRDFSGWGARAEAELEWGQGQAWQYQQTRGSLFAQPVHGWRARRDPLCQDPWHRSSALAHSIVGPAPH